MQGRDWGAVRPGKLVIVNATETSGGFGSAFQLVGSPTNLADLYDWFEANGFDAFDWDSSYFGSVNYSLKTRIPEDENGDEITLDPADCDHDEWVNELPEEYLDNNGYTPFTQDGYAYTFLNGSGHKVMYCDRPGRWCTLKDN